MNAQRVVGIGLLLLGVVLFAVGMNASDSVADRFSHFFTGQFTDATTWYIVGGIASAIGGSLLVLLGKSKT